MLFTTPPGHEKGKYLHANISLFNMIFKKLD